MTLLKDQKRKHQDQDFWDHIRSKIKGAGVCVTQEEFDKINEYSFSLPTGCFHGKIWRREIREGVWKLGVYLKTNREGVFDIMWFSLSVEKEEKEEELPYWML